MEVFSDSEGNVVKVPDMVPIRGTERVRGLTCGGEGHVRGGETPDCSWTGRGETGERREEDGAGIRGRV